jgi:hypothetical protein
VTGAELFPEIVRGASISPCDRYRYSLSRTWPGRPDRMLLFVMLNPSTADHEVDDPTVRRCMAYATSHGFGSLEVVNLFPFRTSSPRVLWATPEAKRLGMGMRGNAAISSRAARAAEIIAAWGGDGRRPALAKRADEVELLLRHNARVPIMALRTTMTGTPGHPLYVPGPWRPSPWRYPIT